MTIDVTENNIFCLCFTPDELYWLQRELESTDRFQYDTIPQVLKWNLETLIEEVKLREH